MLRRDSLITIRANAEERRLLAAVAQRLEQTEAAAFRQLLAEKAERLGLTDSDEKRQPRRAGVCT